MRRGTEKKWQSGKVNRTRIVLWSGKLNPPFLRGDRGTSNCVYLSVVMIIETFKRRKKWIVITKKIKGILIFIQFVFFEKHK
jgi:hypothetical protein